MQKNKKDSLELQAIKNQIADINKKLQNCVKAVENGLISDTITNHINDHCRIGSLEMFWKSQTRQSSDHCRIGSLEIKIV